jgi:putative transposase
MDFVSDALFNGKRFRALTVVDAYTRECLAIHADQGIKGEQVVDVMDRLLFERGSPPAKIRVDNVLCWEALARFSSRSLCADGSRHGI